MEKTVNRAQKKPMTAVVLQARIDSTRLPRKALLTLGGQPIVFRVMEALKRVPIDKYVLACPEDCVSIFAPFAEKVGFEVLGGSKDDVLARYCTAVNKFALDRLIRATGDNPFVFADAAIALERSAARLGADYAGYAGLPYGAGVEVISASALLRAERYADLPEEREHVCPYLYHHPELFLLHRPLAPLKWQGSVFRVTIDTNEDYERAKTLFALLDSAGDVRHNGESIIAALRRYSRVGSER
ncbi:MAG: spore coat protein [Treponema sp.]|jgi:spore coat polysaccharide biosynthesis protein SpsF|nr:spore coat protein [Treponema sp.]